MSLSEIPAGDDIPKVINVIIEIPAFSDPVKYEIDKASGRLMVDRFLATAMHYPCNYGYVPETLSEDGDPVDVLVPTPFPLVHGAVICCRPVGMLNMVDEKGRDSKILALPVDKLTPLYSNVHRPQDLPAVLLEQIAHFFEHYKDLEKGKWTKIENWTGAEQAEQEIQASVGRYQEQSGRQ